MLRLVQLINQVSGENIGLYQVNKGDSEMSSEDVESIFENFHNLIEEGLYDEAQELLDMNNIERVFVEQEVFVGDI